MKYASLLLVLSAASLPGCGPAEDASVPVVIEAAPASPAPPPEAPAQTGEPVAGATTTPAPVAAAAKPSVAGSVATEAAPAADKSPIGVSAADASQPDLAHGQQIYRQACAFCHDRGAAGAPKIGDAAAWGPRLAPGMETLTASVLRGKGAMPAKGGNPALTDADVRAAVAYLVAQAR